MVEFTYEGVDKSGKRVSGKLDVANEGDLRMTLRNQGVRPTRIKKTTALNTDIGALFKSGSVPTMQVVVFTRQLHVLINSGIPLLQSLEILVEQSSHPGMQKVLSDVKERVSRGTYLWESMAVYPRVFSKLYVALVRAGEASGSLDQMLKRLSRYLEDSERLKKQIKSAMMYPIIVMTIGISVVAVMLVFVIPKFEDMLKSSNQSLPFATQLVINTSHFLVNNIGFFVLGGGLGIYLLLKYFRSDEGRAFRDRLFFRVPIFGPIMQMASVARFARTLQTLLASGVNLIDAIEICRAAIDNVVLEEATAKIRSDIESGLTLGMSIKKLKVFPKMTFQMIQVGESTGSLDKMLDKIADFYESDVESLISGMSKLIEPLILVFLGGAVGGMMLAMYLPIFKLAGSAGGME